jgi:hypothetical protein
VKQGTNVVRSFLYDAAGNMTRDTRGAVQVNYAYNYRNRLRQTLTGTVVKGNYTYDGFERLAMREVLNSTPNSQTHYLYNEEDDIIAEAEASSGAILREYIYMPGEAVGGGGKGSCGPIALALLEAGGRDRLALRELPDQGPDRPIDGRQPWLVDAVIDPDQGTRSSRLRINSSVNPADTRSGSAPTRKAATERGYRTL